MEGVPQRVDDTLIFTDSSVTTGDVYTPWMDSVPAPWMTHSFSRRWILGLESVPRRVWIHTGPHRFRYELAPSNINNNTRIHSAATHINERATEQQNAQNQSGSRLSKECISDFLISSLCRLTKTEENRFCAICQEEMNVRQIIAILRCNHSYDVGCIRKWLMIKNECPVCRAPAIFDENV